MALNTQKNIVQREPTKGGMRFLSELEAAEMWGEGGEEKRGWMVDGNMMSSFLDPKGRVTEHPVKPTHPMRLGNAHVHVCCHGSITFDLIDKFYNSFPPPLSFRLYDGDHCSLFSL